MRTFGNITPPLLAIGLLLFVGGCGGGASESPSIVVKPAGGGPAVNGGPEDETNGNGTVAEGYGTFTGRVVVKGTVPKPSPLLLVQKGATNVPDPSVCAAQDVPNDAIIASGDGGLENVFIYLRGMPPGGKQTIGDGSQTLPPFDQKGCRFFPHALVLQTGQTLLVKNSDPVNHNVKTIPKFNDEFNQTLGGTTATAQLTYRRPEQVPCSVVCNIHTWMRAYHLPLNHPYAVVTKPDGSFTIPDLPVGTHTFKLWHEVPGEIREYQVKITEDGRVVDVGDIEIDPSELTAFKGPKPREVVVSFNPSQ